MSQFQETEFDDFVEAHEASLRAALVSLYGPEDGRDATAEGLAWAWENWHRVRSMRSPRGYVFRVAQSKSRQKRQGLMPYVDRVGRIPEFEPELAAGLSQLSESQRIAVVLVYGCDWTYDEVAEASNISKSSVGTHLKRGLNGLRRHLEVDHA